MTKTIILFILLSISFLTYLQAKENRDYTRYHQQVVAAETLIAAENYSAALQVYEELFDSYSFIFLRDYQIATQLALLLEEEQKAMRFLKKGISSGWKMRSIKRNKFLRQLRENEDWKSIKKQYRSLHEQYEATLNQALRKRVKKMFSKDQWKAIGALFTFSSKAQDRYAEKKFAPHSEKQLAKFSDILEQYGYPGERLIGNDFWMSTILSHHNSISQRYGEQDMLYPMLKPKLKEALKKGQMSAFEFALIEEWSRATKDDSTRSIYGILDGPNQANLTKVNKLRKTVYLRSIEVHNKLVEIEEKTGMDFYLEGHPWMGGRIEVK